MARNDGSAYDTAMREARAMKSLDEAVEAALKARKWTPDDIGYWCGLGVDAASRVDLSRFVKITAHVGEGWNTALAVAGEIADAITPLTDHLPEPNRRAIGGIREGLRSGIYSRLMRVRPSGDGS